MFRGYDAFTFGDLLRGFRERDNTTRRQLSQDLKRHHNTLAAWERNDYPPQRREDILDLEDKLLLTQFEVDLLLYKANLPLEYGGAKGDAFGYLCLPRPELDPMIFPLRGGRLLIGRDMNTCDIVIPDGYRRVSRQHAFIFAENGVVYVEDKASTNGTYVDGVPVGHGTPIEEGQHLLLGGRQAEPTVCVLAYVAELSSTL